MIKRIEKDKALTFMLLFGTFYFVSSIFFWKSYIEEKDTIITNAFFVLMYLTGFILFYIKYFKYKDNKL